MRLLSLTLSVLVVLVCACACARGSERAASRVDCPLSETRLYLDVYQGTEPGDLFHKSRHWISVYCGISVTPVATLSNGIENLASQIEHDNNGNIYLSDHAGEHDPGAPPDAFLIYDKLGRLVRRIPVPGDLRYFVTNKNSGESSIFFFPKVGGLRVLVVGGNPPHVQREYPVPPDAGFPLYPMLDESGTMFYFDSLDHAVRLMNLGTGSLLAPHIINVRSFIIGSDNKIYVRAFFPDNEYTGAEPGVIRVYDPRNLRLIRSFPIDSKGFRDIGPLAASRDGTVAVALEKSRTVEIYAPGGMRPNAVIRDVTHVHGLAFDNNDTLYVQGSFPSRFGPPGVYAFKAGTADVLRLYSFGKYQAVEDMTLIPGGTLSR